MCSQKVFDLIFFHTQAVVGYGNENIAPIAGNVHVNMQWSLISHGMPYRIFNNGLHQKGRDENILTSRLYVFAFNNALLAESSLLDGEIATYLRKFLRKRNERIGGALKSPAVQSGKLTKEITRFFGIGAR